MPADIILHNAKIATNGVPAFVDALAIGAGKVLSAGADDAVLRLRGPATKVIDAKRRTVIPGLNDSHLHLIRGGLNYNMELRWDGVPSLADALRMLREQARSFNSPSAACPRSARSTKLRPTPLSSFCIFTIGRC
jgi:hypothetical protein